MNLNDYVKPCMDHVGDSNISQKSVNGKSMGWKGLFSNEGDTNEFLFLSNGCAEALNFPHLPLSSTSAPPPNVGIILKCK